MSSMTLLFLSAFWITGIFLGSLLRLDPQIVAVLSIAPLLAALLWYKNARIHTLALCLVALTLAVVRYDTALPATDYNSIDGHVGPRPVEVGGIIVNEPDIRDRDTRFVVSVYHIGSGKDSFPVSGRIQVYAPRFSDHRYGDDILLKGVLLDAPADDAFSYKDYLKRQGIYAVMYHPTIDTVAHGQGNRFLALLYDVKQRLQNALVLYLPEPHAGLAQGILLGVKAAMTSDLEEGLAQTGLTHIVVVSGYNLTVVATLLQMLTAKRQRWLSLLVALGGVLVFTLMAGASPPVLRAAVMVSMTLLARAAGRDSDALTSLLFTAALLVGLSPLTLWDVSFQLSFLSTLGLVLLAPPMERLLRRLPLGLGAVLATSLAAQIMTAPAIALNFHRLSLISPLANVLVQPAIAPFMVVGAVTAVAGLTAHVAVRVAGWLAWLVGAYMVEIIDRLAAVPQASVAVPAIPAADQPALLGTYFAVVALVFFVATHVTRDDLRHLPQSIGLALAGLRSRALIALLAVVAVAVWLGVLYLVRAR